MSVVKIANVDESQGYGDRVLPEDYTLYAKKRTSNNKMLLLGGHQITNVQYTDEEASSKSKPVLRGGSWGVKEVRSHAGKIQSATAQMTHPDDREWSPLEALEKSGYDCWQFFAIAGCPDGSCADHVLVFESLVIGDHRQDGVFIGFGDNAGVQARYTPVFMTGVEKIRALNSVSEVVDTDNPLFDVFILSDNCPSDCSCAGSISAMAVGGGVNPYVATSDDSFSTITDLSGNINAPAGSIISAGYWSDNIYMIAYRDNADPLAGANGGIEYSFDGVTWANATDTLGVALTSPFNKLLFAGSRYIGITATGEIWESPNGQVWELITNTTVAGTDILINAGYDTASQIVYIVGSNVGGIGVAYTLNTRNQVVNITAGLVSAFAIAGRFYNVEVVRAGHVQITGEFGMLYERGSDDLEWFFKSQGTVIGDVGRTSASDGLFSYYAVNTTLYQRNPNTELDWAQLALPSGTTIDGDVTDIQVLTDEDGNQRAVIIVTSGGEIIILEDCLPKICDLLND